MGDSSRNPRVRPQQAARPHRNLPPCEQAQADGVPCTEVGRHCEICEHACPQQGADRQADGGRS